MNIINNNKQSKQILLSLSKQSSHLIWTQYSYIQIVSKYYRRQKYDYEIITTYKDLITTLFTEKYLVFYFIPMKI